MKNKNALWGILLVVLALVLMLYALDIINFNIFFKGWWTLLIIVPALICLFTSKSRKGPIIWLVIGVLLLLCARGILEYSTLIKLIIPVVLLVIGLSLILDSKDTKIPDKFKDLSIDELEAIVTMFQDETVEYDKNEQFKNSLTDVVFGLLEVDLEKAKLDKETFIKSSTVFGSTKIIVPDGVNVVLRVRKIFGSVDNTVENENNNKKTMYIDAFIMFGGLDIE